MNKVLTLLFCLFTLTLQAQFRPVSGSGGGAPNVTIVSPGVNPAAISWANDTAYQFGSGTYPITPSIVQSNRAAINSFTGINVSTKTNISIKALPTTIFDGSSAPGELWLITNCFNIEIDGGTHRGYTNYNTAQIPAFSAGLFGHIMISRCARITIRNGKIERGLDHGIWDDASSSVVVPCSTNGIYILNMVFEDVGGWRSTGGGNFQKDGTAIVPTGWTMEGCKFYGCLRGIEPYTDTSGANTPFFNCIIRNCEFYNMWDFAISPAGSTNTHFATIIGCTIQNYAGLSYHATNWSSALAPPIGIQINGGRGWRVFNTTIRGLFNPAIYIDGATPIDDCVVQGNTIDAITTGTQGYGIRIGNGNNTALDANIVRRLKLRQNNITRTVDTPIYVQSGRDIVVDGNTMSDSNQAGGNSTAQCGIWVGQAGNTTGTITNLMMMNNVVNDGNYGMTYAYAFENNLVNCRFLNNDVQGFGNNILNGGISNRAGANLIMKGPSKLYSSSVNLASIGINSAVDTVISASGVTTNDAVTVQIPPQFWIGGAAAEVSYYAWATNTTATDGQIVLRVINSDTTAATVDFPAVNMTFVAEQVRVHMQ